MSGDELFARFAYPPNELGYCGPADAAHAELASHAREFDGAWPYLKTLADAAGVADPLDDDVVRSYWVGGRLLDKVDSGELVTRLRRSFAGQVTGLLNDLPASAPTLAHHSFHVFVVYPWVRFLDRDPTTPLRVMQDCRIRWGTVESIDGEHAEIVSRRLTMKDAMLTLGDPEIERVHWSKAGESLAPVPVRGQTVCAHWDWVCGALSDSDAEALESATRSTLDLVNSVRTNHH
ncbi:hypothetical protein MycrhN_5618 [Mycolicibacterium rhodesiae NBB3]|jgi:hypothetical protein|uniref:Uncharacterized protein n=1 Tax=Mycolicibacterium rhodesiae (strain NBB3) TaxID=710685 RepID=G8RKV9_MYCRN|nr:DUF6390 family protein [Mycolicibacterium rhodesiae]AEV76086.1 hypothetical protein MycrhN_5618 [Mycolicibacterium rhodesiae NBB3]